MPELSEQESLMSFEQAENGPAPVVPDTNISTETVVHEGAAVPRVEVKRDEVADEDHETHGQRTQTKHSPSPYMPCETTGERSRRTKNRRTNDEMTLTHGSTISFDRLGATAGLPSSA